MNDISDAVRRSLFDQLVDNIRREYVDWMEIGAIAIIFVGFKRDAERLRLERGAMSCERELGADSGPPCWKGRDDNGRGDMVLTVQPDDWCDDCKKRQRIHEEYSAAVKQRGIAMRKLMRRIDKFAKTFPELPARMNRAQSGGSSTAAKRRRDRK